VNQSLNVRSRSYQQTRQLGHRLGELLEGGDVLCLSGDLGAGKTALASGIAAGWGALENVNSPTFVFVHEHHRARDSQRLFHLDCYRLESAADALSIGLDDILAGSDVTVIEWPERILSFLPDERLWIALEQPSAQDERVLIFKPSGSRYERLLEELRRKLESGIQGEIAGKISLETKTQIDADEK